jgi:hypothetical protein
MEDPKQEKADANTCLSPMIMKKITRRKDRHFFNKTNKKYFFKCQNISIN